MCIASGYIHGLIRSWVVFGSLYVMVYAEKWAITYVFGKDPVCGEMFWYQLMSCITSIVMVFGSFWLLILPNVLLVRLTIYYVGGHNQFLFICNEKWYRVIQKNVACKWEVELCNLHETCYWWRKIWVENVEYSYFLPWIFLVVVQDLVFFIICW